MVEAIAEAATGIALGTKRKFAYPEVFTSLPEYTAHRGQVVTVVRELEDGVEYDKEGDDPMYQIRADDGWVGEAWASELEPI